jgi:hypothetical protein
VDDLIHAWFREERMQQTKQASSSACAPLGGPRAASPIARTKRHFRARARTKRRAVRLRA